jgi:hypothetical protein
MIRNQGSSIITCSLQDAKTHLAFLSLFLPIAAPRENEYRLFSRLSSMNSSFFFSFFFFFFLLILLNFILVKGIENLVQLKLVSINFHSSVSTMAIAYISNGKMKWTSNSFFQSWTGARMTTTHLLPTSHLGTLSYYSQKAGLYYGLLSIPTWPMF